MFRLGQKVKCVKVNERMKAYWSRRGIKFPLVGQTYTVRAHCGLERTPGIALFEISNRVVRYRGGGYGEAAFACSWFRAVDERKTDISVFTAILTPANRQKDTADAR
jgi:hypothetical protein